MIETIRRNYKLKLCALCGKTINQDRNNNSNAMSYQINGLTLIFDKKECSEIFNRFVDIYGNDFLRVLND